MYKKDFCIHSSIILFLLRHVEELEPILAVAGWEAPGQVGILFFHRLNLLFPKAREDPLLSIVHMWVLFLCSCAFYLPYMYQIAFLCFQMVHQTLRVELADACVSTWTRDLSISENRQDTESILYRPQDRTHAIDLWPQTISNHYLLA